MNNWNRIGKPIVVLSLICVIVTGALAVTNEVTVMPAAVHSNIISSGRADGSVQSLPPRSLKNYRLFFYRDSNNINHKL